jgi:ADP-heptose:LPS heptosyltransferase
VETLRIIRLFGQKYLCGRRLKFSHLSILIAADLAGRLLLGRAQRRPPPALQGKHVLISSIDYLGDLLILSPVLEQIRAHAPNAKIHLVTASWTRDLVDLLSRSGLVDEWTPFDSFFLNRSQASGLARMVQCLRSAAACVARLAGNKPDISIDSRMYSPNFLLIPRLLGIGHRAGYGVRGLAYTLNTEFEFEPETAIGQLHLDALERFGLPKSVYRGPVRLETDDKTRDAVRTRLGLPDHFLILHASSGEAVRNIPDGVWKRLFDLLPGDWRFLVVGAKDDETLSGLEDRRVISIVGQTTFAETVECVQLAAGAICVDSAIAHVAISFGKPTAVLGENRGGNPRSYSNRILSPFRYFNVENEPVENLEQWLRGAIEGKSPSGGSWRQAGGL